MTLQEIVIDPEFEKTLSSFMRNHWNIFDQHANKDSELKLFQLYKAELQKYLQQVSLLLPSVSQLQFLTSSGTPSTSSSRAEKIE
jgi:hypothetical protein